MQSRTFASVPPGHCISCSPGRDAAPWPSRRLLRQGRVQSPATVQLQNGSFVAKLLSSVPARDYKEVGCPTLCKNIHFVIRIFDNVPSVSMLQVFTCHSEISLSGRMAPNSTGAGEFRVC